MSFSISFNVLNASSFLPSVIESSNSWIKLSSIVPKSFFTSSATSFPLPWAIAWSSRVKPSLTDPSADFATKDKDSSSDLIPSFSQIFLKCSWSSSLETVLRFSWRHLEITVLGTFSGSVVAIKKMTWLGGSSSVFKRALKLPFDNIWTSSIKKILNLETLGDVWTDERSSLICSTPVLEAASISRKSILFPSWIDIDDSHLLQGCEVGESDDMQFRHLARSLAIVVLPTPLVPLKRKAWCTLSCSILFLITWTTWSWPMTSSKELGLYFLARTW